MFGFLSIQARVVNGLRFRLTLTYVVFFTILLTFLGVFFLQTLKSLYEGQLRNVLTEEWAAVRGYLRIEKSKGGKGSGPEIIWYYDRDDPEEALIVDRLRQVYVLMDAKGHPLPGQVGPKSQDLPWDTPHEVQQAIASREPVWKVKRDVHGVSHLIRSGVIFSEDDKPYYIAIGRSYQEGNRIQEQ